MTPSKWSRADFQRQQAIRARLARASFRLEMAELERIWAIVSAHREGLSIRDIARQVGLGPTRVHQLVTSPQADCVEEALSVLREAGWPTPEDAQEADAKEQIHDRLCEEATALLTCAQWLESLTAGKRPVVNIRPDEDYPQTCHEIVDQARVVRMLRRIAHDLEELARAKRVADLSSSTTDADPRLRLRRRLAEPSIEISRGGTSILQGQRAWEDYERRLRQAGLPVPPDPYRHLNHSQK